MPKYIMVYKGEASDVSLLPQEEQNAIMAKWGAWMEKTGSALADIGAPFGPGVSMVDDGTEAKAVALNGYSIVEAADLAGAKKLTDGHPFLSEGKGDFAIELYELMPVPM